MTSCPSGLPSIASWIMARICFGASSSNCGNLHSLSMVHWGHAGHLPIFSLVVGICLVMEQLGDHLLPSLVLLEKMARVQQRRVSTQVPRIYARFVRQQQLCNEHL